MDVLKFFPTEVFVHNCDFDLDSLYKKIKDFEKKTPSRTISNVKGYQGANFKDEDFEKKIRSYIPQRPDLKILDYSLKAWVNINYPGCSNSAHDHIGRGAFMSGILYVKVPQNSGGIVFNDPRDHLTLHTEPMMYYNNGRSTASYIPKENELLLFPYWLVHRVEQNNSTEERISIAFNIEMVEFDWKDNDDDY